MVFIFGCLRVISELPVLQPAVDSSLLFYMQEGWSANVQQSTKLTRFCFHISGTQEILKVSERLKYSRLNTPKLHTIDSVHLQFSGCHGELLVSYKKELKITKHS